MTWLVLTCPVQLSGKPETLVKRRFNMNQVTVYEPNAMGTTIVTLGAQVLQQVTETVNQIDAALSDVTHPLRVEEQSEQNKIGSEMEYAGWGGFRHKSWGVPK